jgi:hypothetical protein
VADGVNAGRSEQGRRLLDEALRLLDVAQAARPAGSGTPTGTPAGTPTGTPAGRNGGQAADAAAPECPNCPFCSGIAYLRRVDPQAVERLTGAVADVAAAVRDLLGGATAPEGPGDPRGAAGNGHGTGGGFERGGVRLVGVQQIDVTD